MDRRLRAAAVVVGVQLLSGCGPVISFHPNVKYGGRAVSIAVNPSDAQRMVVASETGGVFRTTNGGTSWAHLAGLSSYLVTDVEYAPDNGSIVVATTSTDWKIANNGGIWRSTDGGGSFASRFPSSVRPGMPPSSLNSETANASRATRRPSRSCRRMKPRDRP